MQADLDRQAVRRELKTACSAGQIDAAKAYARQLLQAGKPTDVAFCASSFQSIPDMLQQAGTKRLKTFVARSVTIEPVLPYIQVEAVLSGFVLEITLGGFGSYMDEMLRPTSELGRSQADLVLLLLDLEDVAGSLPDRCASGRGTEVDAELDFAIARLGEMLRTFRAHNAGRLVVQGMVVPHVSSLGLVGDANVVWSLPHAVMELNRRLAALCASISDCLFFDVDQVAAQHGRAQWMDDRLFLASRLALAPATFGPYAAALMRSAAALFRAPRKVLCTDLDNTLWGGILGEDGPGGIQTGSAFPGNCYLQYQRYLKQLAARGILLAITSKNNLADVEEAFRLRSADLAVQLEDFTARKIGWNDKTTALRELAEELSLGLDSFVFVDDNPFECEAVRQQLPEVAVVAVPVTEPWKLRNLLAEQPFFDTATVTADDVNRSHEYKAQAQREAMRSSTASRDEFLQSLGIVCTVISALEAPLARSVQLLAKTNQFNLTTRRYAAAEVEQFAHDAPKLAVALRVRDRFGDSGVSGLALARQDGDACWIDSFLLSCRVLGRGIETAMLAYLGAQAFAAGCRWLIGEYIETKKNAPCKDFYAEHGFVQDSALDRGASVFYRLDLTQHIPAPPPWLTLEGNETHELAASALFSS